jgi:hypothetical protein
VLRPKFELVITATMLALFLVAWIVVVSLMPGDHPGIKDESWHANVIIEAVQGATNYREIVTASPGYPPIYFLSAFVTGKMTGSLSRAALAFPNLILFLATLLIIRQAAAEAFDRNGGLAAVLLGGLHLFPFSFSLTTEMGIIFSIGLFVLAAIRLTRFERFDGYLLLMLGTAFSLLSKQTAPVFLAIPFLWIMWEGRARPSRSWLLPIAAAGIGCLIAYLAFYRIVTIPWIINDMVRRGVNISGELYTGTEHFWDHLVYYPVRVFRWLFPVILLTVAVTVLRKTRLQARDGWLVATVIAPILLLTYFPVKFSQYTLPIVPWAVLVLVGISARAMQTRNGGVIYATVVLLLCALPLTLFQVRSVSRTVAGGRYWQNEMATLVGKLGTEPGERSLLAINSMVSMAFYSLENHMLRAGEKALVIEPLVPERINWPDRLVIVRNPVFAEPGVCFSGREVNAYEAGDPSTQPDKAAVAWVAELIDRYRLETMIGEKIKASSLGVGMIAICRANHQGDSNQ